MTAKVSSWVAAVDFGGDNLGLPPVLRGQITEHLQSEALHGRSQIGCCPLSTPSPVESVQLSKRASSADAVLQHGVLPGLRRASSVDVNLQLRVLPSPQLGVMPGSQRASSVDVGLQLAILPVPRRSSSVNVDSCFYLPHLPRRFPAQTPEGFSCRRRPPAPPPFRPSEGFFQLDLGGLLPSPSASSSASCPVPWGPFVTAGLLLGFLSCPNI
ncbi:hypothetical protein Q5P01_003270 [Channa striata]|uniref:Uncharacterized protein n=1 Tax=Channa striata TaxID=64152 RepID=A0AA88NS86_CHASR|nr:hypothetical protein Q5P01_003270 [Channa striata]